MTAMDYEQLQNYQRSLLDRALTEGIRRNEEQTKTWSDFKSKHQQVIDSLEIYCQELTVECMVPIGKKALMRGKLTHTNEILVSLGEGYFAKYSTPQALALCNRRIKRANDILESLEKERNLYEMRQRIPECFDAFGMNERKDLIEHWDEEKLDDWRVQHRQREKEYRKTLAESKATEKKEIKTEDDLFAKLDALELQEELEAELHRLEEKRLDCYPQDLGDAEVYEESSESSDETEEESDDDDAIASIDESIITKNVDSSLDDKLTSPQADFVENVEKNVETRLDSSDVKFTDSSLRETTANSSIMEIMKTDRTSEKSVSFGESEVKYFDREEQIVEVNKEQGIIDDSNENDTSEDNIVRIEFKHSEYKPPENSDCHEGVTFTSPRDIYDMISKPKPILKNTGQSPICEGDSISTDDNSTDEETYDNPPGISAYNTVVREIRENVIDKPFVSNTGKLTEPLDEKRPVSQFKRERMRK